MVAVPLDDEVLLDEVDEVVDDVVELPPAPPVPLPLLLHAATERNAQVVSAPMTHQERSRIESSSSGPRMQATENVIAAGRSGKRTSPKMAVRRRRSDA